MKKIFIEGINGSLELNKKYIYLILSYAEKPNEEHVIWFDEIENIVYKKPTSYKYGFITIYLSTKSFVTNKKKVYKLLLDKIDEKSIESSKEVYLIIKEVIDNKNAKALEVVENDQEYIKDEEQKERKDELEEIRLIIKENNDQQINNIGISVPLSKKEESNNIQIETQESDSNNSYEEISAEDKNESYSYVSIDSDYIEEKVDDDLEEDYEEEEEITESKEPKSIESLEEKAYSLEKELQEITYKEIILSEYIDNTYERKKIDKLIIELKKIIEKIEKIKKELRKHEKILNGDESIKLDDGNVTILSINKTLLNENELDRYIEQYKRVASILDSVKKDTEEISKSSEQRKKDIGLSDEEFEKKINQFKGVKDNKEFIDKLIKDIREDLSKVKWRIERTIEPRLKFKFVRKEISRQTKILAGVTALNGIRPNRSRFSMIALSFLSGVSALSDLLGFDIKSVEYNEIIQKEFLEGLDFIDTDKARFLIESSKKEIDSILLECEKKYSNYPQFNSLRKDLVSLKKDIETQDKELKVLEDKVKEYNTGSKMKILRYNQE